MIKKTKIIIIAVILSTSLTAMERREINDQLNFITKDGIAIRCELMRCIIDAVSGVESDPSVFTQETVNQDFLTASPEEFVALARVKFEQYVDSVHAQKGVTREMKDAQMDWAKEFLDELIANDFCERPTPCLVREIDEVAQEMGVAKPVLKKKKDGNAMAARANDVMYDPHAAKRFAPTPRRRKAGWAHELFHNHHEDTIKNVATVHAFELAQKEYAHTPTRNAVSRVQEVIADAVPQARSRDYAVQFERLWKRQMQLNNNPTANCHPADKPRHGIPVAMIQFHDEYKREQERKAAYEQAQSKACDEQKENMSVRNPNPKRGLLAEFEASEKQPKMQRAESGNEKQPTTVSKSLLALLKDAQK